MFICEKCSGVSEPGEKPIVVVTETRKRTYENFQGKIGDDCRSFGWEVVKETRVHRKCAPQREGTNISSVA